MKRALPVIYGIFVWSLVLWPFAHFGLTRAFHSSPWKNFGLSMYSTHYRVETRVDVADGTGWRTLERIPPALENGIARFESKRQARGTLARPDGLATWALSSLQGLRAVRFVVTTRVLNGRIGLFEVTDTSTYEYGDPP